MDQQFKRILDLVRSTGDRLIVTDANGQNAYVVMDLEQYESLIDFEGDYFDNDFDDFSEADHGFLSEKNINQEENFNSAIDLEPDYQSDKIDLMPSQNKSEPPPSDIWQAMKPANEPGETWNLKQMDESSRQDAQNQYQSFREQPSAAPLTSEPGKTQAKDEEFGEDQFYLEPIE